MTRQPSTQILSLMTIGTPASGMSLTELQATIYRGRFRKRPFGVDSHDGVERFCGGDAIEGVADRFRRLRHASLETVAAISRAFIVRFPG